MACSHLAASSARPNAPLGRRLERRRASLHAASVHDRARFSASKIDLGSGLGIDNFAMPINEATAMNIGSVESVAIADADQIVIINQVDED